VPGRVESRCVIGKFKNAINKIFNPTIDENIIMVIELALSDSPIQQSGRAATRIKKSEKSTHAGW
jgi:hypothetical protein